MLTTELRVLSTSMTGENVQLSISSLVMTDLRFMTSILTMKSTMRQTVGIIQMAKPGITAGIAELKATQMTPKL